MSACVRVACRTSRQHLSVAVMRLSVVLLLLWWLPVWRLTAVQAAGPTPVSGEIRSNQTWTSDGSPYVVTGDVVVKPGVTLTLEPGTVVQFARIAYPKPWTQRAVLRVLGHLQAVGTMAAPVEFTLLEGEAMGDWGGIWIDGYTGGSAELNYIHVAWAQRGLYASGADVHLQNSVFTGNLAAVYLEGGSNQLIETSNFSGNEYGIYADRAAGSIERNVIASNSWGVYSFMEKGLHISHNDIKSNTYGIVHDGGTQSEITRNDFSIRRANDYAVLVRGGHPAKLTENNFLFDEQLALDASSVFWYMFNESSDDIAAPANWWDTTDKSIIEAYTYDKRDHALRGLLTYEPIATERVQGTMDDLRPPQVEILDLAPCSPNGDGAADICQVPYSLSESAAQVTLSIIDAAGSVGMPGDVLWQRVFRSDGEAKAFTTDGSHTVGWDGRLPGGNVVPEGLYEVRITALDISGIGEGEAAAGFRVDLTPPELEVAAPQAGAVLHQAFAAVRGRVRDASDVAVRVGSQAASLAAGANGWWNFDGQAVLTAAAGTLVVTATDRAGNRNVMDLVVAFDPWLTIQAEALTNQPSMLVQGELLNSALKRVEVQVNWPGGGTETVFASISPTKPFATYTTQAAVPLRRGANLVVAYGYGVDDAGAEYLAASTATWVEYNPFYDRVVSHTFTPDVSMITIPSTPLTGEPGAALGLSGDWDLARWQETADGFGYVMYSKDPARLDALQPGNGYWLRLGAEFPQGYTTQVRGTLADNTVPYTIHLSPGWNLIGNPFLSAVTWGSVQVMVDESTPVAWETAVEQGWLQPVIWSYVGGGYRTSATLEPWQGYWVKSSRALKLLIPPPATDATSGLRQNSVKPSNVATRYIQTAIVPGAGEWRLTIVARSDEYADIDNHFGVAAQATAGVDRRYDWEEPPRVLQGITFSFIGQDATALSADIRGLAPSAQELGAKGVSAARVWRAAVHSSGSGPVQLSWPTVSLLPPDVQVTLVDERTGVRSDLRQVREYEYTPVAAGETRYFRFEVQATGAAALAGLVVYPNPWYGNGVVRLRVELAGAALVSAGVYDAMGTLVRRLDAVSGGPGLVELSWDGRNGRGSLAPSGIYQVRVVATATKGDQPPVSAVERLVVWR